tara:strand:- start:16500 stop:17072 length:573 start_codon:yes stop_codon:yes gene_type:complete
MKKRMFIALDISNDDKFKVAQWRDQHLPLAFKAIPAENFHITLVFLGLIDNSQQTDITQSINQQRDSIRTLLAPVLQAHKTLSIGLSEIGYFKAAKVLHVMPSVCPEWLIRLNATIVASCHESAIAIENRAYQPHLSLYRKAKFDSSEALSTRQKNTIVQNICINSFSLYHSYSTDFGVVYQAVKTWKIN